MGYALAAAFAHEGHSVLLISGPSHLEVPDLVDFIPVETANEMHNAVSNSLGSMDLAIFEAAVSDYTPAKVALGKIKKSSASLTLELIRTVDILGSAREPLGFAGTLVGFAAETQDLEANARLKLESKQCDLIIANDVSTPGIGFDSDQNEVIIVYPDHTDALPRASKHDLAHQLVHVILEVHASRQ